MPQERTVHWVEIGRLVLQPELRQTLERLLEVGIVLLKDGILHLAISVPCIQESRADLANLLRGAIVGVDDDSLSGEEGGAGTTHVFSRGDLSPGRQLLLDPMAERSLGDIYRHIPSPPPIEATQPKGIKTKMFGYQLRTLHRMLQREMEPEIVHSAYWIPLYTGKGQLLHLHPSTLEIITGPSNFAAEADARGGILSEEMGVGKTLECISLILSTLGSLPLPDDDEMAGKITSSLALQWPHKGGPSPDPLPKSRLELHKIPNYKNPHYAEVSNSDKPEYALPTEEIGDTDGDFAGQTRKVPSLKQLCAHVVRLSGLSIVPEQHYDDDVRVRVKAMEPILRSATPFYHLWPPIRVHRSPRIKVRRIPIKIFLSTATLVVVPGTLQAQWKGEVEKHTVGGALRVLYLPHAHSEIPSALELANDYDLILLSHARLGKEHSAGSLQWKWPTVPRECRCSYIGSSRTVQCQCPPVQVYKPSEEMSPLLLCKFKRLCVDEGHVAAGNSDMVRMASQIRSECRWIISGTPTESLVGSDLYRGDTSSNQRVGVSHTERKDLEKLQSLLAHFLQVPLLQAWHTHYETPFKRGAIYASTRLWTLLSRVMVRNQPQDITYPLPPLKDEVVRLEFTRLERTTFNVLQSLILLNAVWSQREDDDYFFHHSNRKYLASIMENLSLSCFHFAGPNLREQSEEAVTHARKQLAMTDKWKEMDRQQAQLAIDHLDKALCDEDWLRRSSDVMFGTMHLDAQIVRGWSRQGIRKTLEVSAEEIMAMQRAMRTIIDLQDRDKLEFGDLARTEELITMGEINRRAFFEQQAKAEPKKKTIPQSMEGAEVSLSSVAISSPSKSPKSKRMSQTKRKAKLSLLDYIKEEYEDRKPVPSDSALYYASLSSVSSTKLFKLLEVLSKVPKDEKVIIFSNLDNVLYEVSTALDIAWSPHFIYASGATQDRRNEIISAFRSEQTFVRILLMKTNIGGRGLDLSCANHAIFLEPILDKSLRVQALKRTWRTGQTRPVHATTMVIKETFEEDVLRISETASTHKLSEDPSMRIVVSNPTFISCNNHNTHQSIPTPISLFSWHDQDREHSEIALPTPPITPDKTTSPPQYKMEYSTNTSPQSTATTPQSPRPIKKRKVAFA